MKRRRHHQNHSQLRRIWLRNLRVARAALVHGHRRHRRRGHHVRHHRRHGR